MVSRRYFISKGGKTISIQDFNRQLSQDHAPGGTFQRGTWRYPAPRHAGCWARLQPLREYGAERLGPNLTHLEIIWVMGLSYVSTLLGQEEQCWFKQYIYPPAIKHGVPESSQFVPWFYHSNLQREWDFHGFPICFSYFPMIFPLFLEGFPLASHISDDTLRRNFGAPRLSGSRLGRRDAFPEAQGALHRSEGRSGRLVHRKFGRWRGYPEYIYSMYLEII